jgi:hypothetical protein
MSCPAVRIACGLALLGFVAGCSYESIRLHERGRCGAMPQSESTRCYSRTQDTQAEYEAKRRKLRESGGKEGERPVDPRYEQWIP